MNPNPDAASNCEQPTLALGGRTIIPGLAVGHAVFHWSVQSFVVALPEIQQTFGLSGVGVGGILAAREFATAIVKLPGGVAVDSLRRYWGPVLAGCLGASALGLLILGVSPVYPLLLIGIAIVAASHSIWHLPASASLSHHYSERRGVTLAIHGVGGSVGDVAGPSSDRSVASVPDMARTVERLRGRAAVVRDCGYMGVSQHRTHQ